MNGISFCMGLFVLFVECPRCLGGETVASVTGCDDIIDIDQCRVFLRNNLCNSKYPDVLKACPKTCNNCPTSDDGITTNYLQYTTTDTTIDPANTTQTTIHTTASTMSSHNKYDVNHSSVGKLASTVKLVTLGMVTLLWFSNSYEN